MNINNANNTNTALGAGNANLVLAPNDAAATLGIAGADANHPPAQLANGAPQALGPLGNHSALGEDSIWQIARLLTPHERLALGPTQRSARRDLAPILQSARRTVTAEQLTSLASFESVLHATVSASATRSPDEAQGRFETMSALARRVLALPWREQIGAIEAFSAAIEGPTGLDPLSDLVTLRDEVVSEMRRNAPIAASAGVNVQQLVAFHHFNDEDNAGLQHEAVYSDHPDSATAAVLAGQNIAETAIEFGITLDVYVSRLEVVCVRSTNPASAGFAARAGGHVGGLAQHHGITTEAGLYLLQQAAFEFAALPAVRNGEDAYLVIQRHGIVDEWLTVQLLEAAALHQAALAENAAGATDGG
jgi:hypothetical protein